MDIGDESVVLLEKEARVARNFATIDETRDFSSESSRLPACQTILDAIRNLLTNGCQVQKFLFAADIVGLARKLPIHRRLVPKVIIPIHACPLCARPLLMAQSGRPWVSEHGDPNLSEPIRKVWIHDEGFATSRSRMIRIMARRMKAATVLA
jgi:hypothetical protein